MDFNRIEKLATVQSSPSITVALNTHRTHPDNAKDSIVLKNLIAEAEQRLQDEYDEHIAAPLIDKLRTIASSVDPNYHLDSLHLFVSAEHSEVLKLAHSVEMDGVYIDDRFRIRPLIKSLNRSESYLILFLTQKGVQLYRAQNDAIEEEIENEDFPMGENPMVVPAENVSHSRSVDNKLKEYFNLVDKAVVREYHRSTLSVVVITTEENFRVLREVADKPEIYVGYTSIDFNRKEQHQLAKQAWEVIKDNIEKNKRQIIEAVKEAVGQNKVYTDLQEIYRAAVAGRGEILVVDPSFTQPATIVDESTLELVDDPTTPGAEDDIVSYIAWKVLAAGGQVVTLNNPDLGELSPIALKTRY